MTNKHQVHNLIILDESGSMDSIKKSIIEGFNELVQTMKGMEKEFPEQEQLISIISFNGLGQKILHFLDPVAKLEFIDSNRYKPEASTPLYDAMGLGFTKLKQLLENKTDYNVLVTILTDGEENASKEYSGQQIKKMIEELKDHRWTFTYIGAEHDVEKFAHSISISNTITFEKNERNLKNLFAQESESRMMYSKKIRANESTTDDFYLKDETKK